MKRNPVFIRTIDPENFDDVNFDVNVTHISSRKNHSNTISIITVDSREHYVFTAELKEHVSLPGTRI